MDNIEELIGGTITDALDGAWVEVTLDDGRVATLVPTPNFHGLSIQHITEAS